MSGGSEGGDPMEVVKVVEEATEGSNDDELLEFVEREATHQLCSRRRWMLGGDRVTELPEKCWPLS